MSSPTRSKETSRLAHFAAAGAAVLFAACVQAQTAASWPSKAVRWVLPYAPGGPVDVVSRVIAPKLAERIGQTVIVENRAGAAGNIAADAVAKAAPDGHTVLYVVPAIITNPFFFKSSPDPKELAPVIHVANVSMVLLASTSFAPKTVAEIVALVRARPGTVSCGSSGALATVGCELLRSHIQADMIMVMYKGNGPALNAIMGGELNLLFDVVSTAAGQVKAGRARAIASLNPRRGIAPFADLATVAETFPGFELVTWHGVMAPVATPRDIVLRMNREIGGVLAQPDIRQRLTEAGFEIAGGSVQAFEEMFRRESAKYGRVLKEAGVRPE